MTITTIFYFFCIVAEAVVAWGYAAHLFYARRRTAVRLSCLCVFYLVLFFVSMQKVMWLNTVFYFILNFIFFLSQYTVKWYSALFHTSVLTSLMGACELFAYGIVRRFSPHFPSAESSTLSFAIFGLLNKLIFFIVVWLLIFLMKPHKNARPQTDLSALLLIFIPATSVFAILTFLTIGEICTFSAVSTRMITLSAIFLLLDSLLVFGINQYNQKKQTEFTEMQLLLQKEADSAKYYEMLRQQNENQQIFIHDIKKHLQAISVLNEKGDSEQIRHYLEQLVHSAALKESVRLCNHKLLNSILCRYQKQCTDKNISFHADIRNESTDFIADTDVTSLFCNLLDNAVAAAEKMPDSFIELSAGKREGTPFTVITMINSCRWNPFSGDSPFPGTSKADARHHGFGLKSVQRIVDRYHGNMQVHYQEDSHTFHTILMLRRQVAGK